MGFQSLAGCTLDYVSFPTRKRSSQLKIVFSKVIIKVIIETEMRKPRKLINSSSC